MPCLVTAADHKACAAYWCTDESVLDYLTAGLNSGAEECVGSAAEHEVLFPSDINKLFSFFKAGCEGLFGVNVLAGKKSCL